MSAHPRHRSEEGAALILTIGLMLVAAVIGAAMMLLSQTETYASYNYKLMTQARYGAESGVHKAVNYLLNSYTPPAASAIGTTFVNTNNPVTYNGQPVVLSARSDVSSNYPTGSVQTAFNTAAQGSIAVGAGTVNYSASARLLATRVINDYGAATQTVIQTWQIDSQGTLAGTRPATVEVSAVLERQVIMVSMFGLFATADQCSALGLGGGITTDSYDSTNLTFDATGKPVTTPTEGNVGTNGNLTLGGTGSVINGSLSTPRTGVGNCNTSGSALTLNGGSSVTEGIDQMPQAITFPTPAAPNPMPGTSNVGINKNTTCGDLGLSAPACSGVKADPSVGGLTLNPSGSTMVLGNVSMTSGSQVNLSPGTYNVNSWSLAGNSALNVIAGTNPVVFNVAGTSQGTPIDFTGGSVSNPSYASSHFQLVYGGTGTIKLAGGAQTALMAYAPNASSQIVGGTDFYGSVLAATIDLQGGSRVHYDKHGPQDFGTAGNFMLSSFSWKKS